MLLKATLKEESGEQPLKAAKELLLLSPN